MDIIRTAYYIHGPEVMKLIIAILYVSFNDGPWLGIYLLVGSKR